MPRIAQVVSSTAGLRTLREALIVSGIDQLLSDEGPYTLFAPNEDAFTEVGVNNLVALAADSEDLAYTLRAHVVSGRHTLNDLENLDRLVSLEGTELFVSRVNDGGVYIEEARVVRGDIEADNGVVHIVDLVFLPPLDQYAAMDEDADSMDEDVVEAVTAWEVSSSSRNRSTGIDSDESLAV